MTGDVEEGFDEASTCEDLLHVHRKRSRGYCARVTGPVTCSFSLHSAAFSGLPHDW
jgi:hypothetical protein